MSEKSKVHSALVSAGKDSATSRISQSNVVSTSAVTTSAASQSYTALQTPVYSNDLGLDSGSRVGSSNIVSPLAPSVPPRIGVGAPSSPQGATSAQSTVLTTQSLLANSGGIAGGGSASAVTITTGRASMGMGPPISGIGVNTASSYNNSTTTISASLCSTPGIVYSTAGSGTIWPPGVSISVPAPVARADQLAAAWICPDALITVSPNRPEVNSLIQLLGAWLFEAAMAGVNQEVDTQVGFT
ncbi:unnamed protein product [Protopolystoma xenopodis]|uniref:Uncharacterized protein n=1 Tax=Protopolystoma xenopodis TaxID=117903 RepID=A0A3S5FG40_9PLAT|nr:unnamed protein product [Protopolystoma xenopodis]